MNTLSPLKAIRAHCIECSGGAKQEVAACIITECPLYPFRLGTNPNRRGVGKIHNVSQEGDSVPTPSDEMRKPHSTRQTEPKKRTWEEVEVQQEPADQS